MGLFNSKKEGGLMDIIRCDEDRYLIHKWSPSGEANSSKKENAIRYGSSLRVKDGEMAIFVYKQDNGIVQDFIQGPYDGILKTENFPVLSNIVGLAFGGASPFQAEVYFINLAGNIQVRFGISYFDVFDPAFPYLGIPCVVRGTLTFNIGECKNFIKQNRLINFDIDDFNLQIKDFFVRKAKSIILNIPSQFGISVLQLETKVDEISDIIKEKLAFSLLEDFGVNLKRLDIGNIELNKEHPHYIQIKKATADQQSRIIEAKTEIEITNLNESNRILRKDLELGVEAKNIIAHQLNQQTEVLKTASENLGQMGNVNLGSGGLNSAGLMMGLNVGGAIGNQMGSMFTKLNNTPPPPPQISSSIYHVSHNGQQAGPYNIEQLKQLISSGEFTKNHYVWKEGMDSWKLVNEEIELANLFSKTPPPPPM